jgi:TonB family protein
MVSVAVMCAVTCTVFAAGTLDHAGPGVPEQSAKNDEEPEWARILTPHEGVDFRSFMKHLVSAVKGNWYAKMPTDAEIDKGKVVVRFKIKRDGALVNQGPTVEISSGTKSLDDAVVAAIRTSAPFEHLPESFKGPSIELRLMFFYNQPLPEKHP